MTGIPPALGGWTGAAALVADALNAIADPCSVAAGLPAGLVDMGLVAQIQVGEREDGIQSVAVVLRVTDPRCMMSGVFVKEAHDRLARLPGIAHVDVSLDPRTIWTPELMTEEYRSRLAAHRAGRRWRDASQRGLCKQRRPVGD